MRNIRVIAKLEINNSHVIKGKHFEGLRRVGDPNELSSKYYLDGIDEIIVMDAVASLYDRNSMTEVISELSKNIFIPITVGGGIRSVEDIQKVLDAGADKVAINSHALEDLGFIKKAVRLFGSQAIVGSVVARKNRNSWEAFKDNARTRTHRSAAEWANELGIAGVGEILISSIDKDGIGSGFDIDLVQQIVASVSVPVIADNGAGNPEHIGHLCRNTEADAICVSSMLHYGKYTVLDIKKYIKEIGFEVR
jgi:imidazole glycerol-phosphate synthase subunit HisF